MNTQAATRSPSNLGSGRVILRDGEQLCVALEEGGEGLVRDLDVARHAVGPRGGEVGAVVE